MKRVPAICVLSCLVLQAAPAAASPAEAPVSLTLPDLEGVPRDMAEFRGRIVVLNFWATWCLPCREEMPIFRRIRERYGPRGVEIVAASTDEADSQGAVARFVRRQKMTFPVLVRATTEDMSRLGLGDALPATAILDADGNVAFRIRGPVTEETLDARLDFLLDGPSAPEPERLVEAFEHDDDHGHGHEGEEEHEHGGVGMEGASLVPS